MKIIKLSTVLFACVLLFGCASGAKIENMTVKPGDIKSETASTRYKYEGNHSY